MESPRVLVVDDEAHIRVVIRELVKSISGTVVGELENGLDILNHFEELQPDLILLDINMPFKTGDELVTELKQNYPEARIIILTGIPDSETIEQCICSGASGYIRKDLTFAEMREKLLSLLENE
jgi:two-component system chemotaxis response regulator CheY